MPRTPYLLTLAKDMQKIQTSLSTLIGYPVNLSYDYSELSPFFHSFINNIGDPFANVRHHFSSHRLERNIVRFIAKLYNLSKDDQWGYITNGGTESNMYGIFMARELYPDGILYFSQDTHYSITKIAQLLRIPYEVIPSRENGEIDYLYLEKKIRAKKK